MTLAGARVGGGDLLGAEMHHSGSTERRAERVELPLFHIAQLEPVGLW
jgi:hypothetical protein